MAPAHHRQAAKALQKSNSWCKATKMLFRVRVLILCRWKVELVPDRLSQLRAVPCRKAEQHCQQRRPHCQDWRGRDLRGIRQHIARLPDCGVASGVRYVTKLPTYHWLLAAAHDLLSRELQGERRIYVDGL